MGQRRLPELRTDRVLRARRICGEHCGDQFRSAHRQQPGLDSPDRCAYRRILRRDRRLPDFLWKDQCAPGHDPDLHLHADPVDRFRRTDGERRRCGGRRRQRHDEHSAADTRLRLRRTAVGTAGDVPGHPCHCRAALWCRQRCSAPAVRAGGRGNPNGRTQDGAPRLRRAGVSAGPLHARGHHRRDRRRALRLVGYLHQSDRLQHRRGTSGSDLCPRRWTGHARWRFPRRRGRRGPVLLARRRGHRRADHTGARNHPDPVRAVHPARTHRSPRQRIGPVAVGASVPSPVPHRPRVRRLSGRLRRRPAITDPLSPHRSSPRPSAVFWPSTTSASTFRNAASAA